MIAVIDKQRNVGICIANLDLSIAMQTTIYTMNFGLNMLKYYCIFERKRFDWSWHWGKPKNNRSQNNTVDTKRNGPMMFFFAPWHLRIFGTHGPFSKWWMMMVVEQFQSTNS